MRIVLFGSRRYGDGLHLRATWLFGAMDPRLREDDGAHPRAHLPFPSNMAENCTVFILPTAMLEPSTCPCGGPSLATCCGPYLAGGAIAQSAETLMRSRYSAYTLRDEAYLRATWHPSTLPSEPIIAENERVQWLGLAVESTLRLRKRKVDSPASPDADTVEFVARYKIDGRAHRLHEVSRFVREQSGGAARWFYLDGSFPDK